MNALGFDFAAHMETVARALLGDPQDVCDDGREWRYGTRGSLAVQVRGPKRGRWYDHEAGQGGGVLDLIRREKGLANGAALAWIRDELGADIPARGRAPGRPSTADYARSLAREMRPLAGSPAELYLTGRGLTGPWPDVLGFHPSVSHKGAGRELPALVCLGRDARGEVRFAHAVFLDRDGCKAAVTPVKLTFGSPKGSGAAIRIPATDPGAGNRLALTEGVEDALSIAQADGREVWAVCGTSFASAPVPTGAEVLIGAQNDPPDAPAERTVKRQARRLQARGFPVRVAFPPEGVKDWNDVLRASGPRAVRQAVAEAEARSDWQDGLIYSSRGEVKPLLANAIHALRQHWDWRGVLWHDEFAGATVLRRRPPWEVEARDWQQRAWTDRDDVLTADWLQRHGIHVSVSDAGRAVQAAAGDNRYHPVREWLDGLKWDGTRRLDDWLMTHLGASPGEPTGDKPLSDKEREEERKAIEGRRAYLRAVGAKFLIQAAARIYQPGCKADCCPILEGPQGGKKSTALRKLFGDEWFAEQIPTLGSKDSMVQLEGKWLIELAELDSLARAEVSAVKAFMSTQVDRYRPPYGKRATDRPRQCVFAGSVNLDDYLRDETGGRRFWPVKCGRRIDVAGLERDRAQLWAEAVHRFKQGEVWWLDNPELNQRAEEEQAARYTGDPWKEEVKRHIGGSVPGTMKTRAQTGVLVGEVLEIGLGLTVRERDQRAANRVARILRSLKWERRRVGPRAGREWRYFPAVSQYEGPCPSSPDRTGTRETHGKSGPYPSVPVSPTCSETSSGEKPKNTRTAPEPFPKAEFSRSAQERGGEQLGDTGTQGYGPEAKGENRVPLRGAHSGTPGATGTPGNGTDTWDATSARLKERGFARVAPEEEEHDADAEERAAIREIDGEGAAGPAMEVFEI